MIDKNTDRFRNDLEVEVRKKARRENREICVVQKL